MSRFFIERPIFAWVVAIVIMLAGLLALRTLPVSQYPQIAPTTVSISASYPGADAQTVENSVTKVIEQGMTGVDNLQYMSATSTSSGQATITLTFTSGADPDVAQMQVQNKLQLVTAQLPQTVQNTGITVAKAATGFLLVAAFVSRDGRMSTNDLADYVDSTLNDTLKRVPGVGSTQLFGAGYAMRIWLDPDRLQKYALMPSDVVAAIQAQNVQVSAGQLGGLPQVKGQQLNATVTAVSRLQTVGQFENIILKSGSSGSIVRLNDVARVELGAKDYTTATRYNGAPATGLAVSLATGANALNTAAAVKATIDRLKPTLPEGIDVVYPFDTTPFVQVSIEKVVHTLFEAIILVFIVMYVFLQNFRATLIPMITVPVVLLGTFGVLAVAGYSVNTLTMFAMVLAIGLLVDDAIVVVENVERVMQEEKLSPKEATIKSMGEITGALVGIATVLAAVFVPMAFFGGSVGVIYRQFSITIVTAMALSVVRDGRAFVLPAANAAEAALVDGLQALAAPSLASVCAHLAGREPLAEAIPAPAALQPVYADLLDVKGQAQARRALEIAAAGGHSLLMVGPPGTGKTMLAQRLPGILPPMSDEEAMASAAVQSIGSRGFEVSRWRQRPYRAPHHTASAVALVGGGGNPRPGEVSLAMHGVLFLDELPEGSLKWLTPRNQGFGSGFAKSYQDAWSSGKGMGSMVGAGAQPWRSNTPPSWAGARRAEDNFKDLTAPIPKAMAEAKTAGGLRVGQGVFHNKFGEGVVLTLEGNGSEARVQVNFGRHGTKWLMLSVAKLTPIE